MHRVHENYYTKTDYPTLVLNGTCVAFTAVGGRGLKNKPGVFISKPVDGKLNLQVHNPLADCTNPALGTPTVGVHAVAQAGPPQCLSIYLVTYDSTHVYLG